jgi:predicted hydrocarbon binding protein
MTDEQEGEKAAGPGIDALSVADWARLARPTLGDTSPVLAFRAVRLGALGSMAGAGLSGAVYLAGRNWARALPFASVPAIFQTMTELRLGLPRLIGQTPDQMEIEIAETLSAAGVPNVGEPLCHLEAGFLAGALGKLTGQKIRVRETGCWGLGQQTCRFVARIERR